MRSNNKSILLKINNELSKENFNSIDLLLSSGVQKNIVLQILSKHSPTFVSLSSNNTREIIEYINIEEDKLLSRGV